MTTPSVLRRWQQAVRWRQLAVRLSLSVPLLSGLALAVQRMAGNAAAIAVAGFGLLAILIKAVSDWRRINTSWLNRALDSAAPALEDSTDLLSRPSEPLTRLQRLQQQRVRQRALQLQSLDLRTPWPTRRVFTLAVLAVLIGGLAVFWPRNQEPPALANTTELAAKAAATPVRLVQGKLRIQPPAYTQLPTRLENGLQAKFPENSRLQWQLTFAPQPAQAAVMFFDGTRLPLKRTGPMWVAERSLANSDVYRIEVDGRLLPEPWQRLQSIADRAPEWRIQLPEQSLTLHAPGQRTWILRAEAQDDYGLAAASLHVQRVKGSGENIQVERSTRVLSGTGGRSQRSYTLALPLDGYKMEPGDDLIVQFQVMDNRPPVAQTMASAHFILRWPTEETLEASGVEGMLKKVMPAYFRSQRQIIIDTEKLLAEQNRISRDVFDVRSDTIGVDQRILRLRYGQFLGEEAETEKPATGSSENSEEGEHADDDGHDHGQQPAKPRTAVNSDRAILEEFGHTHDIPEAATLLDPETRKLLRAALNEMWQAELHLRSSQPKKALPYEYRALEYIKKVQQASRIYLPKVGHELPAIDASRRLTGDRTGLRPPPDAVIAADDPVVAVREFWLVLDNGKPDIAALRTWLTKNASKLPDALALKVALATFESEPDCSHCRLQLKALLWPILQPPISAPSPRRTRNDDDGAYLKALQQEQQP